VELVAPVVSGEVKPVALKRRNDETGRWEKIAEGYEYPVSMAAAHEGRRVQYAERRLVVCSLQWAKAQKKGLAQRVKTATAEIKRLNQQKRGKARPKTPSAWQAAVEQRLRKYRVVGLVEVTYQVDRDTRPVRAYKDRPATVRVAEAWQVQVAVNRAALAQAQALLGWRVYATNAPVAQVSLTQAGLAYRGSPVIERGFRRLKGPLSLTPLYLTTTARLTGLVRVLLIGLRVLGLIE
jgi:transposase